MAEEAPAIDLGLVDGGKPVVLLRNGAVAADAASLLSLAPGLAAAEQATALALALNHLAHASDFTVITDPQAFEAEYRRKLGHEDPSAPWQENVVRLSDFGVPDFAKIQPPRLDGERLSFFARDSHLGVPYQATAETPLTPPRYVPMPLSPVSRPNPPSSAADSEIVAETQADRDERMTEAELGL